MKKKLSLKNIYLLSVIGIGLIGLALGSTYAMFITNVEIDNPISLSTNLSSENDIIETVEVTVPANDHIEVPLTINNQSGSTLNYSTFYVSSSSDIEVGTKLSNSDSSIPTGTISSNTTKKVYVQIKNNTSSSLTITLGVSSSINNIVLSSSMVLVPNVELTFYPLLADYITDLYTSATKTTISQFGNSASLTNYIEYNAATDIGLMNDRLGSKDVDADAGNIRYYGASPNNYIYFNCTDYNNQSSSTCETWRVIGVFDGKVKIINTTSIGSLPWDQNKNVIGISGYDSNWATSSLNKILNVDYYNGNVSGTITSYSGTSGSTSTSIDMNSKGLKNNETRSLISSYNWNVGGHSEYSIYSNQAYTYERGNTVYTGNSTIVTDKIAIPYASDYGYAADPTKCAGLSIYNYNRSTTSYQCRKNDWLFDSTTTYWTLLPTTTSNRAFYINSSGSLNYTTTYTSYAVKPTLFLIEESYLVDGDGSSSNPFQLQKPKNIKNELTYTIKKLYNGSTKTTLTNNSITYNYSSAAGLINDRLGNSSINADGGNIRYYGANPNNYIYFNCDDYSNQSSSTCEVWRIIGIVDGKVKIIRSDSIGEYSWDCVIDSGGTANWSNNWSTATLNSLLNDGYYNNKNGYQFYNNDTNPTTIDFKTSNIGIKNTTSQNMISSNTWYLGGYTKLNPEIYSSDFYKYERGTTVSTGSSTTWNGKIAVLYPSDYGYAADLTSCTVNLYKYDDSTCTSNNWLSTVVSEASWTITQYADGTASGGFLYFIQSEKRVDATFGGAYNHLVAVRPTLYLNRNVVINNGTGTSSNPYKITID